MRCGTRLFGAELQQQRAATVVEPQLGTAHGVPRRLLAGHQQEEDRGSAAARTGVVGWQRGLGDRQSAAPGFPEPAALGVGGQIEPLSPVREFGHRITAPYAVSRFHTRDDVECHGADCADPRTVVVGRQLAGWIDRYRAAGHVVHAPAWPQDPGIGLAEAVDHFDAFVRALPDPPILIGHSMGGLITQLLVDRGLGRAGVAIQPSKPRGVLRVPMSMLRSIWPVLRDPRNRGREVPISPAHFHYVFANTVSRADSDRWHARLAIAAPGRVIFDVAVADFRPKSKSANAVDFARLRPRTAATDRRRP